LDIQNPLSQRGSGRIQSTLTQYFDGNPVITTNGYAIELIQYCAGIGLAEFDDVISNGLGALMGYSQQLRDYLLFRGAHPAVHRVGYFLCLFLFSRKLSTATTRLPNDTISPMMPIKIKMISASVICLTSPRM
jgi:hypothetical protein